MDVRIKRFKLALHLGCNLPKINLGGGVRVGKERGSTTLKTQVWVSALLFFFFLALALKKIFYGGKSTIK